MGKDMEETSVSTVWDAMVKGETDEGKLLRIELFMCAILAIFLVLALGSLRRAVGHWFFRMLLWAAYTTSYSTLFYTVGLMNSTPLKLDLFAIWAMIVLYTLDSTDFITAHSLEDNEKFLKCALDTFIAAVYVGMVVASQARQSSRKAEIWGLYGSCMARMGIKITALYLASKSSMVKHSNKVLSDYMRDEHELVDILNHGEINDRHPNMSTVMEGCNYVVSGDNESMAILEEPHCNYRLYVDHPEVITVKKVWTCKGSLLSASSGTGEAMADKLKDACLSFALYKLLRRRLAGYPLLEMESEKGRARTWRLVHDGLFAGGVDSVDRAFRVVEVELAFLFDFFYTKYAAMLERGFPSAKTAAECIALFFTVQIAVGLEVEASQIRSDGGHDLGINASRLQIDVLITKIVLILWSVAQVLQLYTFWTSDWLRVWLVSQYVRLYRYPVRRRLIEVLVWSSTRRGNLIPSWSNTIGQHEVLTSTYVLGKDWWRSSDIWGPVTCQLSLPSEVKHAVLLNLTSYISQLLQAAERSGATTTRPMMTYGVTSLKRHGREADMVEKFQWVLCSELGTPSHTILVWHVATWLFYHERIKLGPLHAKDHRSSTIAKFLSNYSCYLVACIPEIVPGNAYATTVVYESLVDDIKEMLELEQPAELEDLVRAMEKLKHRDHDVNLVQRGIKLWKQLGEEFNVAGDHDQHQEGGTNKLWEFLADFWCEMILYIAPSDETSAHIERLTRGGELVTHLWALLTHAGILQRQPYLVTTQPPN